MQEIAREILERASQGDIAAFEEVYKAASGFVYSVACRITRNNADAEEVTQDVFMKIYHNLKKFEFRSAFKTWLYRITVNTAINRYRKSKRESQGKVDYDDVEDVLASSVSADEAVAKGDAGIKLDVLLKNLNPHYKACLLLREIEGLRYEEIAAVLKIPINTVRSRLKRARQALFGGGRKGLVKDGL